jgi:tetratricopeptide (TPR) repeat protein
MAVNELLVALLGMLLATNSPLALSNPVVKRTASTVQALGLNDPVELEYSRLVAADDAAQEEVDKWIREHDSQAGQEGGVASAALALRIEQRLELVRRAYEDFVGRHPNHVQARLAYGSFLYDVHDEEEAVKQWEKARDLDGANPAAWNNLGNHYGHRGPTVKAFECYERAIALAPDEPVYYQNLATTVYLFRKDAMEYYHLTEEAVFERALALYRRALKLDPKNFPLATDLAQSYYGIKPGPSPEARAKWKSDALAAWNHALEIANDEVEREGVYIHLARIEMNTGGFAAARKHLAAVTNQMYTVMKNRLEQSLARKEQAAKGTNAAPTGPETTQVLPKSTRSEPRSGQSAGAEGDRK